MVAFQAQNPAISNCAAGWSSCTTFSGAMAASFDRGVAEVCTGCQLRTWTGDTVGGTNLAQIDTALNTHVHVDLDVRYRYPWADFARRINAGQGAVLQGWYGEIHGTHFDAGGGFTGNHAIFVPPGWGAMDPLADGRRAGIYKYHGEAYPQSLLRGFAGLLNIGSSGQIVRLGDGLVYAAFTRDKTSSWQVTIRPLPGQTYRTFTRYNLNDNRQIKSHSTWQTKGFQLPCSAPQSLATVGTGIRVSVVKISNPGGSYDGWWVSTQWSKEV